MIILKVKTCHSLFVSLVFSFRKRKTKNKEIKKEVANHSHFKSKTEKVKTVFCFVEI